MRRADAAGVGGYSASNGADERELQDGEYPIDMLVRVWKRIASHETLEGPKKLPFEFLEQLDHDASGGPKRPALRYG